MGKVFAVARTEYLNAVRSKAFIIGLLLMPVFMGGALVVNAFLKDRVDVKDRELAVLDLSGQFDAVIASAAQERNEKRIFEYEEGVKGRQNAPRFVITSHSANPGGERADLVLSNRVRDGDLFGFVVIPEDILAESGSGPRPEISYHTETPTFRPLPRWLERTINSEIVKQRFIAADVDQALVGELNRQVPLKIKGLVEVDEDGEIKEAEEKNEFLTNMVPMIAMMLLYMMIMMNAPALLNQVLEEKMQRISEVLISAVSPFQLMMGKLTGTVMVALTLSTLYLGAAYYLTLRFEVADAIPLEFYGWFFILLLLALFMYGSIFSAVGAACSELRDAQSLMMPVMLLVISPFFFFVVVLQAPSSTFATVTSLFPPATPMLMMLRIAIPPGPAWWELVLAVILTGMFTAFCVWAGGKIFRIGILAQGQTPTLGRLAAWVFSR